ncbi:MAG: MFS transporter, partial [Saprospiraceae bacterium]
TLHQIISMSGTLPQTQFDNKKVIRGWTFFDWANSAYSLVISTAIFPAYFMATSDLEIKIGGNFLSNSSVYAYSLSIAYLFIAFVAPLLSGLADFSGKRKYFMKIFTTIGSLSCISLFFFKDSSLQFLGLGGFVMASIGFAGSLVFYNSYLPIIASHDNLDKVSAKGFAMGYVGSVLLLIINLLVVTYYEELGLPSQSLALRLAFVSVGLWWFGFAQITFKRLPSDRAGVVDFGLLRNGFKEIKSVYQQIKKLPNVTRFLLSFFAYSAGVQTVLYMAAPFAEKELKMPSSELIGIILILQLVAIFGAFIFSKISKIKGNRFSLFIMLIIWILACVFAFLMTQKYEFYILAVSVGLVMGGIQSLSRSTYAKLIQGTTSDYTSYYSFYDMLNNIAIVLGTFSFGMIEQVTGNMHYSALGLSFFFIVGIILLTRVRIPRENPALALSI